MVTYVGGDNDTISGTTFDLTWPTVAASDQALLSWTGQADIAFTDPTGFTLVEAFEANTGTHEVRLYRRTCTGSEDGTSITLTMASANKHCAALLVYRGVATTGPVNAYDIVDEDSGTGTHACPQVTPSVAGCAIVAAVSERLSSGTTDFTPPAGYSQRQEIASLGGGGATMLSTADDGLATAHPAGAAVSPGSFTGGDATDNTVTWTVALAPAAQTVAVAQAVETDTANAVAWAPKHRLIAQALETDVAFGSPIVVDIDQAVEIDEATEIAALLKPVVTWGVAIDWDGDGDFTTTGDDVTGRALERAGLAMQYGRDQTRELSPSAAGAADLELDNTSKDYSPDNADSPLAGNVLPARPLKITAAKGGTTHTLFTGFTDGYDVKPARSDRSVDITALDAVAKLKGVKATTKLYRGIRTGTAIGYVLDAIGWPDDLRDLDDGATTARWWWVEDQDAFEAIQKLVQAEGPPAMLTSDEQGQIVFRDRHHRLVTSASTTPRATFTDESEAEPSFTDLTYDHGWGDVVNSVAVKVDELDPPPAAEVIWENESNVNIGASDTLTLRITLDTPAILPTVSYTTLAGTVTDSITVDSGQTLTLTLTASTGGAAIAGLKVLGFPVVTQRTFTILLEDADSITSYGRRSLDYEVPWAGVHDAGAVAQLMLDASAQRRPIVTITLRSGTRFDSDRLTEQLSRDLSDRVHIREPQTCVDHPFHIEQISHRALDAGLILETTFGMERAIEQGADVFRFNDDDYGFDDGVFASVALTDPALLFRFGVTGQGFDDGVFAT